MSIKHWNETIQPREKALKLGFDYISDSELLAIVLRSGYKGCSSVEMANVILNQIGGLAGLNDVSIKQLMKIKGIKLAKATELVAIIELSKRMKWQQAFLSNPLNEPRKIADWLQSYIGVDNTESMVIIFVNNNNQVITYKKIAIGNKNSVSVEIKQIFNEAIKNSASAIFLAHNHPSGILEPSITDIDVTEQIIEAGNLLQIPVIDHIIVSNSDYYSFKQNGII